MKIKINKKALAWGLAIFVSLIGTMGLFLTVHENRLTFISNDILSVFVFLASIILISKIKYENRRDAIFVLIVSLITGLIYGICSYENIIVLNNLPISIFRRSIFIILKSAGAFEVTFILLSYIIKLISKKWPQAKKETKNFLAYSKKGFIISFLFFFVLFMIYFLNVFPGSISYDFATQIKEALGYNTLVNHHPFVHTLAIRGILSLSAGIFGNYTFGIAAYSIIQIILCSLTFAAVLYLMAKHKIPFFVRLISFLFIMIVPIFGFYASWLTKDIIFGLSIAWLVMLNLEIYINPELIKRKKYIICFILALLVCMFTRKNGVYVASFSAIVSIIALRQYWKYILIIYAIPIVIFAVIDGPVRILCNIENGSSAEMLSVPLQQIARVYVVDNDRIDNQDKEKIELYLGEHIVDNYDPLLSDPIKANITEAATKNKMDFLLTSIKLFIKYPITSIDSFLLTTHRFYYLENNIDRGLDNFKESGEYAIKNLLPEELGISANALNLYPISYINKIMSARELPIISCLCGSGFYIIICLISLFILIYRKEYRAIILFAPLVMVFLTQLAGPVVDQRYVYGIMISSVIVFPFSICKFK